MGTNMAVDFSVIFMADLEKRLLAGSPLKPFVWKRFIDDIFPLWNIPIEKVSIFVNFADSFHPTTKFTSKMSSESTRCFSRYRGSQRTSPFISWNSQFTNPSQAQWFSVYTLLILPPILNTKKASIKEEALRLLKTNSVNETLNKDSVTEAIPGSSFLKSWLKFSSPTEHRLFVTKEIRRKKLYRLLPLITRLHRILKRFSWNTGASSFNSNLPLHISLNCHQLYLTLSKEKSLKDVLARGKPFLNYVAIKKTCKQRRTFKRFVFKPEGNLHMIFC